MRLFKLIRYDSILIEHQILATILRVNVYHLEERINYQILEVKGLTESEVGGGVGWGGLAYVSSDKKILCFPNQSLNTLFGIHQSAPENDEAHVKCS